MAWRCRFLTARRSQHGSAPDSLLDLRTVHYMFVEGQRALEKQLALDGLPERRRLLPLPLGVGLGRGQGGGVRPLESRGVAAAAAPRQHLDRNPRSVRGPRRLDDVRRDAARSAAVSTARSHAARLASLSAASTTVLPAACTVSSRRPVDEGVASAFDSASSRIQPRGAVAVSSSA